METRVFLSRVRAQGRLRFLDDAKRDGKSFRFHIWTFVDVGKVLTLVETRLFYFITFWL